MSVPEPTEEHTEAGQMSDPAPKKEKPISQRMTVTEVRQRIRAVQANLSILRPGEVVSPAYPLLREFAKTLTEWERLWSEQMPEASTRTRSRDLCRPKLNHHVACPPPVSPISACIHIR